MSDLTNRLNPPSDFSIVEEYIEDQAPRTVHDAFNRIKSALQNQGAVANEPPAAAATPCKKFETCQLPKGEACHYGPPACFD
jgi:hypothetical protein